MGRARQEGGAARRLIINVQVQVPQVGRPAAASARATDDGAPEQTDQQISCKPGRLVGNLKSRTRLEDQQFYFLVGTSGRDCSCSATQ